MNSESYLNLLKTDIADRIMDLPLATIQNMYFQQGGAPPHNARIVTDYLDSEYPNKWIGNQGLDQTRFDAHGLFCLGLFKKQSLRYIP